MDVHDDGSLTTTTSLFLTLPSSGGGLLTTHIADMYGDSAPGVLVLERDSTLHYLELTHPAEGSTLIAPPGGKVVLDADRAWVAAAGVVQSCSKTPSC